VPAVPGPTPGAALEAWFARQAAREARAVYLEGALLTGEFRAYARYRLRYFFLRYLADAVLHAARFLLLYALFSANAFVHLVVVTALAGLLGSFWWGALEGLRARVRHRFRDGRPYLVPDLIGRWLGLAAILSGAAFCLTVAWIAWDVGVAGADVEVRHLYVFAVGLRLAVDFLALTFHSGVYAVRRIYRPLPAIVGLELVGFLVVLGLWPWLAAWCFPVAMLAGTAVSTAVLLHYTSRLYRHFGFLPVPRPILTPLRWPGWPPVRESLTAGTAHALMRLDAVLVLTLVHARRRVGDAVPLFLLFFGIGPTVRAGFDWAHLFYFDLKRLETWTFRNLRARFDRFLVRLALVMGVVFWGLACVFWTAVMQRPLGDLYWLLGPFFITRSALALVQIRAFAERRYAELLGSGVLLLVGIGALQLWVADGRHRLALLIVLTTLVAALLAARQGIAGGRPEAVALRSLPGWVAELGDVHDPVVIRSARLWMPPPRHPGAIPAGEGRWRQRQLARRVARHLGRQGGVTTVGFDRVTWYERSVEGSDPDQARWLALGGGLLEWIGSSGVQQDGAAALEAARQRRLLDPGVYSGEPGGPSFGRPGSIPGNLRQAFLTSVPDGIVYAPDQPLPEDLRALTSREKRDVLQDALAFVSDLRVRGASSHFEVTALVVGGELRFIFLAPRSANVRARRRWVRVIRSANLGAALRLGSPSGRREPEPQAGGGSDGRPG
jgi:hypothetical protein